MLQQGTFSNKFIILFSVYFQNGGHKTKYLEHFWSSQNNALISILFYSSNVAYVGNKNRWKSFSHLFKNSLVMRRYTKFQCGRSNRSREKNCFVKNQNVARGTTPFRTHVRWNCFLFWYVGSYARLLQSLRNSLYTIQMLAPYTQKLLQYQQ